MRAALVSFKDGVRVERIRLEVFLIISIAAVVYFNHGLKILTVTSVSDGKHKKGSKHYTGEAVDLRIWSISRLKQERIVADMQTRLGPDYDVILEDDHIHAEYDPKVKT